MQIDIVQIVGLGLIATFLSLIVKEQKPTFAFLIVVFAGCAIFLYLVDQIYDIIRMIEKIAINANVNMVYVETILKIIGIAYIAEFGAQLTAFSNRFCKHFSMFAFTIIHYINFHSGNLPVQIKIP